MISSGWIFAEFISGVEILTTGREYNQIYGGLFHVIKEKIQYYREYFSPETFRFRIVLTKKKCLKDFQKIRKIDNIESDLFLN